MIRTLAFVCLLGLTLAQLEVSGSKDSEGESSGCPIGNLINKAKGILGGAVNTAKGALGNAVNTAEGVAGGAVNKAKGVAGDAVKTAEGSAGGAVNKAKGAAGGAVDAAKGATGQGMVILDKKKYFFVTLTEFLLFRWSEWTRRARWSTRSRS